MMSPQRCFSKETLLVFLLAQASFIESYGTSLVIFNIDDGVSLFGHVFKNMTTRKPAKCQMECVDLPTCMSINMRQDEAGLITCEMSKSSKVAHPQDLKARPGFQYKQIAEINRCNTDVCIHGEAFPDNWFRYGSKLLKFFSERRTWDQAQNICQTFGGGLVTINSQLENEFVFEMFVKNMTNETPPECHQALGMENGAISDGQINASTILNQNHLPHYGRLNSQRSWIPGKNDVHQWIQVDLGNQNTTVTGVATQGRQSHDQWVTRYKLQYRDNTQESFMYYAEQGQVAEKEFVGNTDRSTIVHNELIPPIRARYIRLRPTDMYGFVVVRMEIYGCQGVLPEDGDGAWIGLNDVTTEGTFQWKDGSHVIYTKWGSNPPKNQNSDQDCVQMKGGNEGAWDDDMCIKLLPFICEKKA